MRVIIAFQSHYFNALNNISAYDFDNINTNIFNSTSLKDAVMLKLSA